MTAQKTIALFSKPNCPTSWGVLNEIVAWANRKGIRSLTGPVYGGWDGNNWSPELIKQTAQEADFAIAIGGDGTLLGMARNLFLTEVARQTFDRVVPVLGVNLGTLGYLTDVAAKDIGPMLDALLANDYAIEERILLKSAIDGVPGSEELAFNDVVFSSQGRLAEYDVFVNKKPFFSLRADGLIITTPTGSTAYALSAHGPILHPSLAAVALVPNNAHSMSARPVTLPSNSLIEVVVRGKNEIRLDCDGRASEKPLTDGMRVTVTQAKEKVHMLHLSDYSLFNTLRTKLHWAEPRID